MNKKINLALVLGLSIANTLAIRDISSIDLIKDIKIGWNLGNSLDADCTNWLDYNKDQIASETCWGNPVTTEKTFTTLINYGINLFRIPVTWSGHYGHSPNYTIDRRWLSRVREIVDYSYQHGAYVIIDCYHDNWINPYNNNINESKNIAEKLWKQIAEEFIEYDEHLIFESMNSPRKIGLNEEYGEGDEESWKYINEINHIFINTIRNTGGNNSKRHLLIPSYAAMPFKNTLSHLDIPVNDNKIMVSLHTIIPDTHKNFKAFTNISNINKMINTINKELIQNNIAVIITEFGVPNSNNENERVKWAENFISETSNIGIPCILWDNGKMDKGSDNYGIIDRSSYTIQYPDYLNTFIEGSKTSIKKDNESSNVFSNYKRENPNSNIKIESYVPDEGEEEPTGEVLFNSTNIMIALNNTKKEESNEHNEIKNGTSMKYNIITFFNIITIFLCIMIIRIIL